MNIVFVSREYPPLCGGGIGTYARHIAPALAARGCRVHVVTGTHDGRPTREEHGPITVHRVPMAEGSGSAIVRGSLEAGRTVARLARSEPIDIVEFAEYEGAACAFQMFRAPGDPDPRVVVHFHSPTELNLELNGVAASEVPAHARATVTAERWSIENADGWCAPSRFMAEWATSRYDLAERPVVIPYAIEPLACPVPPPTGNRLLYVGRLEHRKGVDVLVQAWARIAGSHPDWRLRLVGSDTGTAPGGASMRAHLESLLPPQAARRTTFVDRREPEALAAEYAGALVCVTPSRWENFPNTCLEAMRAGRAVLVSDSGGMREMLGDADAGAVVPAGDVDAWATALSTAMATPRETLLQQGAAGRARIGQLCDPFETAGSRIEFYRRVAATTRERPSPGVRRRRLELWRHVQQRARGRRRAGEPA